MQPVAPDEPGAPAHRSPGTPSARPARPPAGFPVRSSHEAPRRTCVGCRASRAKPDLVRIAATPTGVRVDALQHLPGRGAYVCPTQDCVERVAAREGQSLRRALRTDTKHEVTTTLVALRSLVDGDAPRRGQDRA